MKKLILLAAVMFGAVTASQAGVHLSLGFGIPLGPPAVAYPAPPPVVYAPAPVYQAAPPVVYYAPPPRVVYAPPPVVYARPTVVFGFGTGWGRHGHQGWGRPVWCH